MPPSSIHRHLRSAPPRSRARAAAALRSYQTGRFNQHPSFSRVTSPSTVPVLFVSSRRSHRQVKNSNRYSFRHWVFLEAMAYEPIQSMELVVATVSGYRGSERQNLIKLMTHAGVSFVGILFRSNAFTHLVCWKFEGRKYELAKKFKIIIVNH